MESALTFDFTLEFAKNIRVTPPRVYSAKGRNEHLWNDIRTEQVDALDKDAGVALNFQATLLPSDTIEIDFVPGLETYASFTPPRFVIHSLFGQALASRTVLFPLDLKEHTLQLSNFRAAATGYTTNIITKPARGTWPLEGLTSVSSTAGSLGGNLKRSLLEDLLSIDLLSSDLISSILKKRDLEKFSEAASPEATAAEETPAPSSSEEDGTEAVSGLAEDSIEYDAFDTSSDSASYDSPVSGSGLGPTMGSGSSSSAHIPKSPINKWNKKPNKLSNTTPPVGLIPNILTNFNQEVTPAATTGRFPVWYATNRQGLHAPTGQLLGFSTKIAADVSYGKCLVHIPAGHIIGQTRSTFWRRILRTLTFREDDQALRVVDFEQLETASYWAGIQAVAANWAADERCAVVFLHGYNVSFEDAAVRAAQIGYDLQIRGPIGFFSWPSKGKLLGYSADESAIEASEAAITQYLRDFAHNCGAQRVHVIAHSMGNRGLLRALQRIVAGAVTGSAKLFEHFILAAPDVDQKLFLDLADHYSRAAHRTTLYVSNKDLALASSRMLRTGMARAGLTPPVTIAPHIDTVHVANVDMTLLGHGYVAEARDVLADMHQLLYQNAAPNERMGLRAAEEDGHRYWVIGA